ncbi:hypothetical protein AURDEDRAFT_169293 [Auricularia subglabra TFB-10046 SS5]|nr:hypothetical protein AURDEDRAFT_169293 [Auricularia subglabra TFB-10046 SS5]
MSLGNSAFRDANVQLLRANHAELLSRIMAVATADHDDASRLVALHSLQAAMNTCSHRTHALHMRLERNFSPEKCLPQFITSLCTIVQPCFPKMKAKSLTTKRHKFSHTWPTGSEDLLPLGSVGFRALAAWLGVIGDTSFVNTLTRVFLYCRPSFFSQFSHDEESRSILLSAICTRFKDSVDQMRAACGDARDSTAAGGRLGCLLLFLNYIPDYGRDEWTDWPRLFRGYEIELLTYASSAMSHLGSANKTIRDGATWEEARLEFLRMLIYVDVLYHLKVATDEDMTSVAAHMVSLSAASKMSEALCATL